MTFEEAVERYGVIENKKWANEPIWCSVLTVPDLVAKSLINSYTGAPTTKIYCNKDIQEPLLRVFEKIIARDLLHELKTCDGCFNIRSVRGESNTPSTHSYALAIDINAAYNKLGQTPTMALEIVDCFKEEGFSWGGDFKRRDGMHFSLGWE